MFIVVTVVVPEIPVLYIQYIAHKSIRFLVKAGSRRCDVCSSRSVNPSEPADINKKEALKARRRACSFLEPSEMCN